MRLNRFGRRRILTSQKIVTVDNIREVLSGAMQTHLANREDIVYLYRYERGYQPILRREKNVREDINIKVVENTASEIVAFKLGWVFGNRISLAQRALSDDISGVDEKTDSTAISALNQMFDELGKEALDQKLARDFIITGVGYRMVLANEPKDNGTAPFRIIPLDPRDTFVVEYAGVEHTPVLGVSYWVDPDTDVYHYTCYTDDYVFVGDGNAFGFGMGDISVSKNGVGVMPIVGYYNSYDRMGAFERVIPLMDAENICASDRINSIAQLVQAFLWIHNAELPDGWREMLKASGILSTASAEGLGEPKLQYLVAALDQAGAQTVADHNYDRILQIAGVPGREATSGGSDTGQAVMLRNGWQVAETAARASEQIFCESERQFLRIVLHIVETMTPHKIRLGDLDIKFSRNQTDNLLTRVQALSELINTGVDPLHSLKLVSLFPDPQQVYNDSDFTRETTPAEVPPVGDATRGSEDEASVQAAPASNSEEEQ